MIKLYTNKQIFISIYPSVTQSAANCKQANATNKQMILKDVQVKKLEDYVKSIPDFPKKGVIFRDITSILEDAAGFKLTCDTLQDLVKEIEYDGIAAIEARGFIFGAPIAYNCDKPLIMIRKKGKLPRTTHEEEYDLEYGSASIEMNVDALKPGKRVIIVDDLLATGGTLGATIRLVEKAGASVVGVLVLIEIEGLNGRSNIGNYDIYSAITYSGK